MRLRFADLTDGSGWEPQRLDDLWHFDPVWVLGAERYQGHGAVPALRSTNIPGYDRAVSGIGFDPSLGRASHLATGSGDRWRVRRFTAGSLTDAARRRHAARERPRAVARAWRLRPFWGSL